MEKLINKSQRAFFPITFYLIKRIEIKRSESELKNDYVKCEYLDTVKYVASDYYKLIIKPNES
jgi:hypothetical protein